MPLLPEGSSCYIPWLGRWCLSSMLTPVSLVHLHILARFYSFFSLASHASHPYYSLHCLSFVRSFSITATVTFSALFLSTFPLLLWEFHWLFWLILRHSPSLRIVQSLLLLPVLFLGVLYSCASFSFSGFLGFLRGFLGNYRLSSTTSTAVTFYPLSYSPLGSFPRLSSSFTPFREFFCLPRLPGGFVPAVLSFHQFFWIFCFYCPFSW